MAYSPDFPYKGEQIIINSGRVFINSRDDSAFINASKAISLGSGGTLNFDSADKCIVNSPRIDLGLDASHPVSKGDILKRILEEIITKLDRAGSQLKKAKGNKSAPLTETRAAGGVLKSISNKVKQEMKTLNSEITFTK